MEHEARDVLARLAEHTGPPIGFTADEIAARGHRQARNHRIGAMAGGALGLVGVVAVTAAVLPGSTSAGRDSGRTGPLGGPTTAKGLEDPACVADVGKLFQAGDGHTEAARQIALRACPLLKRMDAVLDPRGEHLRAVDMQLRPAPTDVATISDIVASNLRYTGVGARSTWTPDGHNPYSAAHPTQITGPFVEVEISVLPAGVPQSGLDGTMDHLDHPGLKVGQAPPSVPWSAPTTTELADGSSVTVRSEHDSGGSSYLLTRTLRSGERLILEVSGVLNDGQPATPFPFTADQLVAAVSVPGVEDVAVPPPVTARQ